MVGCHLEAGKHKRACLHLTHTKPRDAQHLTLKSHLVRKQLGMTIVDVDSVASHCELDLIYDALARSLNAKHSTRFQDVIGGSVTEVNTRCAHHLTQTVALNE